MPGPASPGVGRPGPRRRLLVAVVALVLVAAGAAAVTLASGPPPPLADPPPGRPPTVTSPIPRASTLADSVASANNPTRWSALLADPMVSCATGSSASADVAAASAEWRRNGRLEATVDPDCFRDPTVPRPGPDEVDGVPLKARASLDSDDVLNVRKGYTVALTCRAERRHERSERSLRFAQWPTDARYWYVSVAVSAVNAVPVQGYLPVTALVRPGPHVYSLLDALPACPAA